MNAATRRRVARKAHYCEGCARHAIKPGSAYLESVVFPGHDVIETNQPIRMRECRACATRYGRAQLLALSTPNTEEHL